MKYLINNDELKIAASKLYLIADSSKSLAGEGKFKLSFENNTVLIEARNDNHGIYAKYSINAIIQDEDCGKTEIVVRSFDIYNLATKVKYNELLFIINNDNLTIETSNGKYTFNRFPGDIWDDVLSIPEEEYIIKCEINTKRLKNVLQKTVPLAQATVNPNITGILFDFDTENLRVVATDQYRLIKATLTGINTEQPQKIRMPDVSANILSKVLPEDKEATIKYNKQGIICEIGEFSMFAKTIDKKYINYETLFEREMNNTKKIIYIDGGELYKSLLRLNGVLQIDYTIDMTKKMYVSFEKNSAVIKVYGINNTYILTEYIDCQYDGEKIDIVLHLGHIKEILKSFAESKIKIFVGDPEKPLLLSVEQPHEEYLILAVPIKENKQQNNNNNIEEDEL